MGTELLLTSKKVFSIALSLLFVSAYCTSTWWLNRNFSPVKKELRQIRSFGRLSRLPVASKDHYSPVLKCPLEVERTTEPSISWIKPFEIALASCQASFQSHGFWKLFHLKRRSCRQWTKLTPFKASLALIKISKPDEKWIQFKLNKTSVVRDLKMKFWPRCAWKKEIASLKFEFHRQMCEFLARSKELIISFVKYQISAFKLSLHHLHNRQSITSGTTDCLSIPLALISK